MTDKTNLPDDGGPAFPTKCINNSDMDAVGFEGDSIPPDHCAQYSGMTLRDYFAAKAMQGWLASYGPDSRHPADFDGCAKVAAQSYAMADALLRARQQGNSDD